MTTYNKTQTAPHKQTLNKHRNFNEKSRNCIEIIRACSWLMPTVSPTAYNLSRYLATWFNSKTANGIVNPDENRVMSSLMITATQLRLAALELERVGWWKPKMANDVITSYTPLFLDRLNNDQRVQRIDTNWNNLVINGVRSSLNHSKVDTRYYFIRNQLAKALTGFTIERITPHYNDLGYYALLRSGQQRDISYRMSHGKRTKLVHSVMFDHPMLQTEDVKIWKALGRTTRLPTTWTENPYSLTFMLGDFRQRVNAPADELLEAIEVIRKSGWWKVDVEEDPFALEDFNDDTIITMTPQHPLHQAVWELDSLGGGEGISKWEDKRGLLGRKEYEQQELPELGYHFIYALRSVMTGKVLVVGQTTQALDARLRQHLREASNPDANKAIKWIVDSTTDSLEILHLATVHRFEVSKEEMRWAHLLKDSGHPIQNKILDVEGNDWTIKEDSRFGGLTKDGMEGELERAQLACLGRNRDKVIIWQTDEPPQVPQTA